MNSISSFQSVSNMKLVRKLNILRKMFVVDKSDDRTQSILCHRYLISDSLKKFSSFRFVDLNLSHDLRPTP